MFEDSSYSLQSVVTRTAQFFIVVPLIAREKVEFTNMETLTRTSAIPDWIAASG